jgi:hypothetical protein
MGNTGPVAKVRCLRAIFAGFTANTALYRTFAS